MHNVINQYFMVIHDIESNWNLCIYDYDLRYCKALYTVGVANYIIEACKSMSVAFMIIVLFCMICFQPVEQF